MKKLFKRVVMGALCLSLVGCGLKASDILAPPSVVPDNCKDAYVYKLGIYPNITSALEVGALAMLASVKDSADPMIVVCEQAKKDIQLGSAKMAMQDLTTLFTKNSKYAPAAAFAVSQIQDRLKDFVLTQCDKDTLTAMFDRIIGYAQASKAEKK
jgi:hypothetical protein